MNKDNPRWLHEIPKPRDIGKHTKMFTKNEKIENHKKLLGMMVHFKEITQEEADNLLEKYKKEIE